MHDDRFPRSHVLSPSDIALGLAGCPRGRANIVVNL
jgi:hypothetical protein